MTAARNGFITMCAYGALFAAYAALGTRGAAPAGGVLIVSLAAVLLSWGSDRLWSLSVADLLGHPGGSAGGLTRLPFWFMAGGAGYTLGVLVAAKSGLLTLGEGPIRGVFSGAAWFGAACRLALAGPAVLRDLRGRPQ